MDEKVLVIGLGEIGRPLMELIGERHEVYGKDIEPVDSVPHCEIMHICIPYNGDGFVQHSVNYIREYEPSLAIVNSTVAPGTTRRIAVETGIDVVNSPVRGKHARMKQELLHYTKFVGALSKDAGDRAAAHFIGLGMQVKVFDAPETTELAKLTETTYFGVMIAWAQEVERYCQRFGLVYDDVVSFYEEIGFFPPVKYFPGVIGGHCVMPNIQILKQQFLSGLLDAVEQSNELKRQNLGIDGWRRDSADRPKPAT